MLCNKSDPQISELIFASFEEYYSLFSDDKQSLLNSISEQASLSDTEVSNPICISRNNRTAGVICFYPSEQLKLRQLVSLKALKSLPTVREDWLLRLKKYRAPKLSLPDSGLYLSRIAVSHEFRRQGIGSGLLKVFEEEASKQNKHQLYIHVRKDNTSAIQMYESNLYQVMQNEAEADYYTLTKSLKK